MKVIFKLMNHRTNDDDKLEARIYPFDAETKYFTSDFQSYMDSTNIDNLLLTTGNFTEL